MKFYTKFIFWTTILAVACAASLPRVKDITELAPPLNVRMTQEEGLVKISWEPSPDESKPAFDGYNIYYAKKSLILASVKKLPVPVMVDKNQHEVILRDLDRASQYFVHVRSRNIKGDLSFPSLPELLIKLNNSLLMNSTG